MHGSSFLLELLILIGSATLVATVFHALRLPTIIGFIVAGMIIGPFGIGWVSSVPGAEALSEIGIIFLMFTIGLEFSLSQLKDLRRHFLGLGGSQVLITLTLTALLCHSVLDLPWMKSFFIGCLLSLSSTAIIMKLLQDSRESASPHGNAIVGVLLFQDLAVIPMMMLLSLVGTIHHPDSTTEWNVQLLLKLLGAGIFLFFAGHYLIPKALHRVAKTSSRELFFFAVLLLCLGVSYLMERVGLSLSFGAFLAGLLIAESPYGRQAMSDILPLRDNFLGLFFASVGMLVNNRFVITHLGTVISWVLALALIKIGVVYLLARFWRYTHSVALIVSLSLFQIGEFSFILAKMGHDYGLMGDEGLQYFFAVTVFTLILSPFLFKWAPLWALSRSARDTGTEHKTQNLPEESGHAIIVGFGVAGQNLGHAFKALGIPYKVIDQNYNNVLKQKKNGEDMLYGDASRAEILEHAGLHDARLLVIAVSGAAMTKAVLDAAHRIRLDIPVIARVLYSRDVEVMGTSPQTTLVVAENETTIELLARSLISFGVAEEEIYNFMADARRRMHNTHSGLSDFLRTSLDHSTWQMLSSLHSVQLKSDSFAVGRSLDQLMLRTQTGATVVTVYRGSEGSVLPQPDMNLAAGDILHMAGDRDSLRKASQLLLKGEGFDADSPDSSAVPG
ncbi:monovalent cation:proton antiporter-2 (CPA2) family protein [Oligoflexus tunisiensis]|uniref:monovalent cation:proton antiporter-2 (CPA2) family protein n=1 Tax=Oligoflexus tunisiensis TaxID=708132 RepID=UPI000B1A4A1B|nr:monovalent cation:proton antiporter-2 (CPA2) family protein [Oligoflexus tunisiensis]